jgi:hypothetical protein
MDFSDLPLEVAVFHIFCFFDPVDHPILYKQHFDPNNTTIMVQFKVDAAPASWYKNMFIFNHKLILADKLWRYYNVGESGCVGVPYAVVQKFDWDVSFASGSEQVHQFAVEYKSNKRRKMFKLDFVVSYQDLKQFGDLIQERFERGLFLGVTNI